jgi:hypothetical protein
MERGVHAASTRANQDAQKLFNAIANPPGEAA